MFCIEILGSHRYTVNVLVQIYTVCPCILDAHKGEFTLMKTYTVWLVRLLVVACIFALGSVPVVYADAHEMGEEEMAEEEASGASGWFRVDMDGYGTQIWFGASHSPDFLGNLSFDTDIYVYDTFGELDLGLGIPVVESESLELTFLPMVGIGFDYAAANGPSSLIVPQLFTYLTAGPISFESWIQGFFNTPFDYDDDSLYTRNFVLYSLNDTIAIGPQVEVGVTLATLDPEKEDETGLSSLVAGLRVNVGYGENNTLGIFVGYETVPQEDDEGKEIEQTGITGRMTLFREW